MYGEGLMPRGIPAIDNLKDNEKLDSGTARIIRLYLERIACKLERVETNSAYRSAYNRIARLIRESKPD